MVTNPPKNGENHFDVEVELPRCKTQIFLGKNHTVRENQYVVENHCVIYIWVTSIVHNILASRREQNQVSNRTSAHLKEKKMLVLIYFP